MSTTLITPQSAVPALALALVLGLAACGGAGTSSSQSSSPGVDVTASADPSPTEPPIDVAAAFVAKARGSLVFVSDLSGTLRVGDVEGEVSGVLEVLGSDTHSLTVITFPGLPEQEVESISVDGMTYERSEYGYWLQSARGGGGTSRDPVTAALANADALEVVGTEEHDGRTLHRIESSQPADISPESLGFTDPSVSDFEARAAFLAEDDGTPAGIIITAEWVQGPEEAPIAAEFELRYMVVGREVTIEAPEDVFALYRSGELGYQMAHPADWDVTHEPETAEFAPSDFYLGPVDGEVQVYRYTDTDLAGATANAWFRDSALVLAERFGSQPELANTVLLANGLEVQIFVGEYTEGDETIFYQQAVVFGGDIAWDLDWYSMAGNEVEDQALFLQFVTSFERTVDSG